MTGPTALFWKIWPASPRALIPAPTSQKLQSHETHQNVEGHVPASDVQRLLAEQLDAIGLTVPGLPIGSTGMEMGDQSDAFDTLLLSSDGTAEVFERHS